MEILEKILLLVSVWTGTPTMPTEISEDWKVIQNWDLDNQHPSLILESSTIASKCEKENSIINFPTVLYSAQEVFVDGFLIAKHGSKSFDSSSNVIGNIALNCSLIKGNTITWKVYSYSQYFARILSYPKVLHSKSLNNFFGVTLYISGALALIVLSIFAFSIMINKESSTLLGSIILACLGYTVYNLANVFPEMGIGLPTLTVNKISDVGLIVGSSSLLFALWKEKVFSNVNIKLVLSFFLVGFYIVLFSNEGDSLQFGTSLCFIPYVTTYFIGLFSISKKLLSSKNNQVSTYLIFLFFLTYLLVSLNDMIVFSGISDHFTLMSVGPLIATLMLILSINTRLDATYKERDYLRENLQNEVNRKTFELQTKTNELEVALSNLKHTQAELIQSAKLASLGTLSAGIAHEINNSINYVNGAIKPLEKMVFGLDLKDKQTKITSLFAIMKEGLSLTVDIIGSLRQYTGLNQAKFNDIELEQVFKSVLNILKTKLRDKIDVKLDIEENICVYGSVVGLNQVFMNLISNAIDSIKEFGTISISAKKNDDHCTIIIKDSGCGIPDELKSKIFDPFFTTKEVGKGTGLGLYIVKKEIDGHSGTISIDSVIGSGTTFTICLPIKNVELKGEAA